MISARQNKKGQALVETAVASIFLVPIVLGLLDVGVMIYLNIENDHIAKNAARAAASQPDANNALQAAQRVFNAVKISNLVNTCSMTDFSYSSNAAIVTSTMAVTLPVSVAGIGHHTFVAKSVQPTLAQK